MALNTPGQSRAGNMLESQANVLDREDQIAEGIRIDWAFNRAYGFQYVDTALRVDTPELQASYASSLERWEAATEAVPSNENWVRGFGNVWIGGHDCVDLDPHDGIPCDYYVDFPWFSPHPPSMASPTKLVIHNIGHNYLTQGGFFDPPPATVDDFKAFWDATIEASGVRIEAGTTHIWLVVRGDIFFNLWFQGDDPVGRTDVYGEFLTWLRDTYGGTDFVEVADDPYAYNYWEQDNWFDVEIYELARLWPPQP